jgi:putative hydrolase of the HAD superfamily
MSQSGKIQAVTFDVGGTLINPWPSVGHVYAEVAARHGIRNLSAEVLQARFRAAWRACKNFNDTKAGWMELVDEVFHGLAAEPPSVTFFPELYERFARPDAWRIFDDVPPALEELTARGMRLGVISNWDERLRELLRGLRLDNYFETIIISCEAGYSKPSPVIFERAAEGLGLPPGSVLHVGDSLEMDVRGAESAGFHAVQIRRGKEQIGAGEIKTLAEVATRLA